MGNMIYVLEDNMGIQDLVNYLLLTKGYDVHCFSSMRTFQQSLDKGNCPDLFILDIMLPDGDGIEMSGKLKNSNTTQHIPILLMSAVLFNIDLSLPFSADDFINKPFDIDDFLSRVQKLIG